MVNPGGLHIFLHVPKKYLKIPANSPPTHNKFAAISRIMQDIHSIR